MRTVVAALVSCVVLLLSALALAAPALDPGADPGGFIAAVTAAVSSRAWVLVGLLMVVAAVYVVRKLAPWSWAKGDRAGAAFALVGGCAVVLAGGLIDGAAVSARWLVDGLYLGATSAGGYAVVRKLLWPSDGA